MAAGLGLWWEALWGLGLASEVLTSWSLSLPTHIYHSWLEQLENLVYYNRLKNSKIVISDFHLAKLENGLIKEPCGTPEYLGKQRGCRGRVGRQLSRSGSG